MGCISSNQSSIAQENAMLDDERDEYIDQIGGRQR